MNPEADDYLHNPDPKRDRHVSGRVNQSQYPVSLYRLLVDIPNGLVLTYYALAPQNDRGGTIFTTRGVVNIGCLSLLLVGIITLFAGYPIITFYTATNQSTSGGYNLGGINSSGQVPSIQNFVAVIDPDTPASAMTHTGWDGKTYNLAFSDEFNKDGRCV